MSDFKEKFLQLPGGRTLAYDDNENTSSSTVVLFFHGMFGIGTASDSSRVLLAKNVHYVAPTLPGWGNSSSIPSSISYASGLASDMTVLINSLHPDDPNLKLYIVGGSFGTVPAQMLFAASFDVFPLGRHIQGLLLLAPLSPLHCHKDYTKSLSMANYISIGPPVRIIPFKLIPRLTKLVMKWKMRTPENVVALFRSEFFDNMGEEEREAFIKWREAKGKAEGQTEREMAENAMRSVAKTWEGFLEVTDILHSDWGGVTPATLDEEHARRKVLVVSSKGDTLAPVGMANWLVANYKNAQLKSIEGGHLASVYHLDEIWMEFLDQDG